MARNYNQKRMAAKLADNAAVNQLNAENKAGQLRG